MDLIIWGHEHESLIYPRPNVETGFDIIQPGSTVATSLIQGESEPKHVCILSISGKEYKSEAIRLKSVRPFKVKDVSLAEDRVTKKLAKKENNRGDITRRLVEIVEELINEANAEWLELQDSNDSEEQVEPPLPLVRLRVEYTAPEGGAFDCENPQRFSNRFAGKVANTSDVVQFFRKKTAATRKGIKGVELPEATALQSVALDSVKVEKLVREFLTAQSLAILPQNSFGDAVTQFVDKDDKHAMELFVTDSLKSQVQHLLTLNGEDEEDLQDEFSTHKSRMEELFAAGALKRSRNIKLKPKPAEWDSEIEGSWADDPGAREYSSGFEDGSDENGSVAPEPAPATRGRGKQAGATRAAAAKKTTAAAKHSTTTNKSVRGRKKQVVEDDDEDDVVMNDTDDQDNSQLYPLFVQQPRRGAAKAAAKPAPAPTKRQPARKAAASVSQATSRGTGVQGRQATQDISDDIEDDDDDDDAFEPAPAALKAKNRRT